MRTFILAGLLWSLLFLAACGQNQPSQAEVVPVTPVPATVPAMPAAVATPVPTPEAPNTPTPAAGVATEPASIAAEEDAPVRYRGHSPYGTQFPDFEVGYDPAVWEFVHDNQTGRLDQLMRRDDPACVVWLQAGPIGMTQQGEETLAGRTWRVGGDYIDAVGAFVALYSLRMDDAGYVIGVILPDGEEYRTVDKPACQRMAEAVIATFEPVEE